MEDITPLLLLKEQRKSNSESVLESMTPEKQRSEERGDWIGGVSADS